MRQPERAGRGEERGRMRGEKRARTTLLGSTPAGRLGARLTDRLGELLCWWGAGDGRGVVVGRAKARKGTGAGEQARVAAARPRPPNGFGPDSLGLPSDADHNHDHVVRPADPRPGPPRPVRPPAARQPAHRSDPLADLGPARPARVWSVPLCLLPRSNAHAGLTDPPSLPPSLRRSQSMARSSTPTT